MKIKKNISFITASKRVKYSGIHLKTKGKTYSENHKNFLKEIKINRKVISYS